jgi:carbamoyl-phosphate synthase large subunit
MARSDVPAVQERPGKTGLAGVKVRQSFNKARAIRTSALQARVTTFTTIAGAQAAVEGMKYLDNLDVYSLQELHAQLVA